MHLAVQEEHGLWSQVDLGLTLRHPLPERPEFASGLLGDEKWQYPQRYDVRIQRKSLCKETYTF